MLSRINTHCPWGEIITIELITEVHGLNAGKAKGIINGVIVIKRHVIFILFVDGDSKLLRIPNYRGMAVRDETGHFNGMNGVLIVK